ncbi:MAG: glutaredoxin family protein [Acidimicrobiales bacterium]
MPELSDGGPAVLVYWRPGCPYCIRLRRQLRKRGLATTDINIWADETAAATVRGVAGGNETVPTVFIGDTSLVNPQAGAVLELASRLAPHAIGPHRSRWSLRSGPGGQTAEVDDG